MRLNDWEESVSHPNMDHTGSLPHNTARIDSFSGCRLHDLQPRLVAKMAKKGLSQQECMSLMHPTRSARSSNMRIVGTSGTVVYDITVAIINSVDVSEINKDVAPKWKNGLFEL